MNEFQQQILQKIEQIALKLENYKSNNQDLTKLKEELVLLSIFEQEQNISKIKNRNFTGGMKREYSWISAEAW